MSRVGVLRFPGTNCDLDVFRAIEDLGHEACWIWYANPFEEREYDSYVIPGGFSFGDYLRAGAMAAQSPAMDSLKKAVKKGAPVIGICNGFQILCEAGLLPGALVRNEKLRFIDRWVELVDQNKEIYSLPIAHGEGRFYIEEDGLKELRDKDQIWLTYKDNPNGSISDIAGIKVNSVSALMPHPERAMKDWMGGTDGRRFFECL